MLDCSTEKKILLAAFLTVLFGGLLGGCDTTVPIFKETGESRLYFSLYGQVGPDGGTIRVERLRDSLHIGAPPSAPETVTLTQAATGSTETLDRVGRRVGQLAVHNYRVPPLEPGRAYQIAVEGPQGNVTSATVQVPEHAPAIEPLDSLRYCSLGPTVDQRRARSVRLELDSGDALALVSVRYYTKRFGWTRLYRWTGDVRRGDEGRQLTVKADEDLVDAAAQAGLAGREKPDEFCPFCEPPPLFAGAVEVKAVAAGPGWPGPNLNAAQIEEYAIPTRYSNVENGAGLVVGIHSAKEMVPVQLPARCCPPPVPSEEEETGLPPC
jgi:hypothetical protein